MLVATQVFSSTGIGLLVGLLLGLSSAPVVGLVVGAVTSLLAGLLGVAVPGKNGESEPVPREQQQALIGLRAGTFGLACTVGLFAGIYMRTHNVLSPPEPGLQERYQELVAIGFAPERARELVAGTYGHTGTTPATQPVTRDTVLFSVDAETCQRLDIERFATLEAAASYYQSQDLEELARVTRRLDQSIEAEQDKRAAVGAAVELLCQPQ